MKDDFYQIRDKSNLSLLIGYLRCPLHAPEHKPSFYITDKTKEYAFKCNLAYVEHMTSFGSFRHAVIISNAYDVDFWFRFSSFMLPSTREKNIVANGLKPLFFATPFLTKNENTQGELDLRFA